MHLSLSVAAVEGACSRCGHGPLLVTPFVVHALDDEGIQHEGETEAICSECIFGLEGGTRVDLRLEEVDGGPRKHKKAFKKAKKTSLKQEVDIANELGGRTQPGSGNQRGAKGDIRKKGELRVEAKFTAAKSFSLKREELDKIAGECGLGEKPIFVIDFLKPGTRDTQDRYAVVPFQDLKDLIDVASQYFRSK